MPDLIRLSAPPVSSHGPTAGLVRGPRRSRYGTAQVVRAELIKLRSLRSTKWTMLAVVAGSLVVTFLATHNVQRQGGEGFHGFDPTNMSLTGLALGSLAIGVLGVLAITGEYGSGTIRASLAATPRRPLFLAGKVAGGRGRRPWWWAKS